MLVCPVCRESHHIAGKLSAPEGTRTLDDSTPDAPKRMACVRLPFSHESDSKFPAAANAHVHTHPLEHYRLENALCPIPLPLQHNRSDERPTPLAHSPQGPALRQELNLRLDSSVHGAHCQTTRRPCPLSPMRRGQGMAWKLRCWSFAAFCAAPSSACDLGADHMGPRRPAPAPNPSALSNIFTAFIKSSLGGKRCMLGLGFSDHHR